jgi:hypothetical protein
MYTCELIAGEEELFQIDRLPELERDNACKYKPNSEAK